MCRLFIKSVKMYESTTKKLNSILESTNKITLNLLIRCHLNSILNAHFTFCSGSIFMILTEHKKTERRKLI